MADSNEKNASTADQWQNAANLASRPKMDMAKALAILGFSSSRTLDANGGHDPRAELSCALSKQMHNIERRKQKSEEADARNPKKAAVKPVCRKASNLVYI